MREVSKSMKYFLAVAAAGVALFVTLRWTQLASVTKESVDQLIRKECPIGSTKDQVYEFLEKRKIPSGGYNAGPDPYIGLPDENRQWKRYVVARIPENPDPPFSKYDIVIYFYFDESYTLTEYKLQQLDNVP